MEYSVISKLKTLLDKLTGLYVGYYPYDYLNIFNQLPALLIKLGNNIITTEGHHIYDINAYTLFILYSDASLDAISTLELSIVTTILETLELNSTDCVINIGLSTILSGDINEYTLPSSTGYNGNLVVRKITQAFTYRKITDSYV